MTLNRQLWLAISALMGAAFLLSFAVSGWSARTYLEEQLSLKNADNANSLALSLAAAGADPLALELLLAAQHDTGHYARLRLSGPLGEIAFGEGEQGAGEGVPGWLLRAFPIEPAPGVAQVSQGWQVIGTLEVQSRSRFAYRELWRSTQRLFAGFVAVALGSGLVLSLLLRWITRPLGAVVAQAQAIGERRFITIAEPRTLEFNALSRAMNGLATRVQQMLAEESQRLGRWHRATLVDPLTGLLAREPFLERLASLLKREDASAQGVFAILRVLQLSELNRRHGRAAMDALLRRCGADLLERGELHEGMIAGRLNGSEIGIAVPEHCDPAALAAELRGALAVSGREVGIEIAVAAATTRYDRHDAVPELMRRADQALALIEQRQGGGVEVAATSAAAPRRSDGEELAHWSESIASALEGERLRLETYPVCGRAGELLHTEGFCRLLGADGGELHAAEFMPWAARIGRMPELDRRVVAAALRRVAETGKPLAINLSTRILGDPAALAAVIAQVRDASRRAPLLWIELPESGLYARIDAFRELCAALRPLGCRLGIEHMGSEVARMGSLYDVGLHYAKLDAALTRGIEQQPGNQAFVRGFCTIAHAIGLVAIATGVESAQEWAALLELGIDGGTGRFFPNPT